MKVAHKDFIAVYHDVFEEGFCAHLIEEFERLSGEGAGSSRKESENAEGHFKKDHQLVVNGRDLTYSDFKGNDTKQFFYKGLQDCYENYIEKYSIIKDTGRIRCNIMKMQRTEPGGGYHVWHCEQSEGMNASRVLVYMLYLNTLSPEQAGETEFLYQQERLKPTENTMVIWPAAFTHPHRGNPVYNDGKKYIVTGWFLYE